MNTQQYIRFVNVAHDSYISSRLHGQEKSHIADLAIETASFFEAMYHILDAYADVTRTPNFNIEVQEDSELRAYWQEIIEKVRAQEKEKRKNEKTTKQN